MGKPARPYLSQTTLLGRRKNTRLDEPWRAQNKPRSTEDENEGWEQWLEAKLPHARLWARDEDRETANRSRIKSDPSKIQQTAHINHFHNKGLSSENNAKARRQPQIPNKPSTPGNYGSGVCSRLAAPGLQQRANALHLQV